MAKKLINNQNQEDMIEPNTFYHVRAKGAKTPALTQFGNVIIEQLNIKKWSDFFNSGQLPPNVLYGVFKRNPKVDDGLEFIEDYMSSNLMSGVQGNTNPITNLFATPQTPQNPMIQFSQKAMAESFRDVHQQTAVVLGDQLFKQNETVQGLIENMRTMSGSNVELIRQHNEEIKNIRDQYSIEKEDLHKQISQRDIKIADLERRLENAQFQNDLEKRFSEKERKIDAKLAESEQSTMKDIMSLAPHILPLIMNGVGGAAAPVAAASAVPMSEQTQQKQNYKQQFPDNVEPSDFSYT